MTDGMRALLITLMSFLLILVGVLIHKLTNENYIEPRQVEWCKTFRPDVKVTKVGVTPYEHYICYYDDGTELRVDGYK